MITAIDSNILLDILAPNPDFYEASVSEMERAANAGFAWNRYGARLYSSRAAPTEPTASGVVNAIGFWRIF
jgi:hypothetical protein